ncbi:hypothetical protein Trydic_g20649 [Trypoxylus dichotomus]
MAGGEEKGDTGRRETIHRARGDKRKSKPQDDIHLPSRSIAILTVDRDYVICFKKSRTRIKGTTWGRPAPREESPGKETKPLLKGY